MINSWIPIKFPKKFSKIKLSAAFSELVGEDPHFKAVLFKAQKAAKSDYPVLIEGESGTGKEILARTIHQTSRRSRKEVCGYQLRRDSGSAYR